MLLFMGESLLSRAFYVIIPLRSWSQLRLGLRKYTLFGAIEKSVMNRLIRLACAEYHLFLKQVNILFTC